MLATEWLVLSLSFFNTICLLWLGLMVLLVGNRRSPGVWLTGGGLLLGALFFTSHTAIFGRGLGSTSLGMNFWWWVSWAPAIAAPLAWYGALFWYAGFGWRRFHRQHLGLAAILGLCGWIAGLLFFANPLPTYEYVAGRVLVLTPGIAGIPFLVLAYLSYSLLCYLLPLDLLNHPSPRRTVSLRAARMHQRARPWLSGASLSLLLAGGVLSWAALWALTTHPLPSLTDAAAQTTVAHFDLAVQILVGIAITLLGRTVVGFEVFTGRSMPRGRFFHHWRSTLLLAGGFGAVAAFSLTIDLRPIYSLMLATALMVIFYALYSWRSFVEREAFMERLRPFVASQDLLGHMTAGRTNAGSQQEGVSDNLQGQFHSLCAGLLDARAARLVPGATLAVLAGAGLADPVDAPLPAAARLAGLVAALETAPEGTLTAPQDILPPEYDWAIPLWARGLAAAEMPAEMPAVHRLSGVLLLAEKSGRAPLTEEEVQIAQAAGERMVDALASAEMARLALDLLNQRLAQTRALEGQGRRVLHDDVLPELHTAILYLAAADDAEARARVIEQLTAAHRRVSDLMRELPLASPHRLVSGGLVEALKALIEGQFSAEFQRVDWVIDPAAVEAARGLPPAVSEELFFAAREFVRNAARHGRGGQPERPLALTIRLTVQSRRLILCVEDDGVGIGYAAQAERGALLALQEAAPRSTGTGLRMHAALLAAVGATLAVSPRVEGGASAVIVYELMS